MVHDSYTPYLIYQSSTESHHLQQGGLPQLDNLSSIVGSFVKHQSLQTTPCLGYATHLSCCCCAGTDMASMDSGSQALAVRYIQKPQDGHADTVAKLSFSPSFVTYNPVTIENVQAFFKTGEVCTCCL